MNDDRTLYERLMTAFVFVAAAAGIIGVGVVLILEVVSKIGGGSSP